MFDRVLNTSLNAVVKFLRYLLKACHLKKKSWTEAFLGMFQSS